MSAFNDTPTVRIPAKIVNGEIVYFYSGERPRLKDGAITNLVCQQARSLVAADWLDVECAKPTAAHRLTPKAGFTNT